MSTWIKHNVILPHRTTKDVQRCVICGAEIHDFSAMMAGPTMAWVIPEGVVYKSVETGGLLTDRIPIDEVITCYKRTEKGWQLNPAAALLNYKATV